MNCGMMWRLRTRNMLEAVRFFLGKFEETSAAKTNIRQYYLYAFLATWRTVLDALLYDLADYYGIIDEIRERNPRPLNEKIDHKSFYCAAERLGNHQAEEALKWWFERRKEIEKLDLYADRIRFVHEGLPPIDYYLPPLTDENGHFLLKKLKTWIDKEPELKAEERKLQEGFSTVEKIVCAAENKFEISLS